MKYAKFVSFILIIGFVVSHHIVWADSPGQTITKTIDQGLRILRDPELQSPDKIDTRRDKLWELLEPIFSFQQIAKRSLGRHWLNLNDDQRQEFTDLFTRVLKDVYLKKSDNYSDGEIVFIREIVKGHRGKVQTNFVKGEKRVVVDISMHQNSSTWKIYDITIEGVSVLTNYRQQFNSILAKSTFEDLMSKLREKEMENSTTE